MNTKRIHQGSIVLTLTSLLLELAINQGWIEPEIQDLVFGISLSLVLIALGLNVKVVRTMGMSSGAKRNSQLLILVISIYAFSVYALEII